MIRLVVQRKDDRAEGWRDVIVLTDMEHRIGRTVRYRIRPRRRRPLLFSSSVDGQGPAPTAPPPRSAP